MDPLASIDNSHLVPPPPPPHFSFKNRNIAMAIVIGAIIFGCVWLGKLFPYNAPVTFYTDEGAEGGMPGVVFGIVGGLIYGFFRSMRPFKGISKVKKFMGFALQGAAAVGGVYVIMFAIFAAFNLGGIATPEPCEVDTWDDILCPGEEEKTFKDIFF